MRIRRVALAWASVPVVILAGLAAQLSGCGKKGEAPKDGTKGAGVEKARPTPAEREQIEKDRETKTLREVAGHSYWKVKPTEADVLKMAAAIAAAKGTSAVFIDDVGKVAVVEDAPEGDLAGLRPEGLGKRRFILNLSREFSKRPTRGEVIERLHAVLDVEDYRR